MVRRDKGAKLRSQHSYPVVDLFVIKRVAEQMDATICHTSQTSAAIQRPSLSPSPEEAWLCRHHWPHCCGSQAPSRPGCVWPQQRVACSDLSRLLCSSRLLSIVVFPIQACLSIGLSLPTRLAPHSYGARATPPEKASSATALARCQSSDAYSAFPASTTVHVSLSTPHLIVFPQRRSNLYGTTHLPW